MNCKKCGNEVEKGIKICPNCGAKLNKKPIFKKWWFWVIVVFAVVMVAANSGGDDSKTNAPVNNESIAQSTASINESTESKAEEIKKEEKITYESVELQTMIDDLKSNALKAEKTYQNKYVEISGKIKTFDSDGDYITIEPTNASEWNFDTVMCKIKNDDQLNFLLEKNVGDAVTVKGQITSIGEVLGYSVNIAEVS